MRELISSADLLRVDDMADGSKRIALMIMFISLFGGNN
jgi:hypothetical protein